MPKPKERILVVENDPMVADLIARQALTPQGFEVKIVKDGGSALKQISAFKPDVVIANLELPGLSGKDLMVGLSSSEINIPVIMIAPKGKEKDVIQAFRLGASDYISSPVREAEVVSAVERAVQQVRARHERQQLSKQLQLTNKELEKRINELTTIFGIGKAVTSITNQDKLLQTIVEGAMNITRSDIGWILVIDERVGQYKLAAQRNLPKSLSVNLNQPWDDGISSLVANSGETFSIHGSALKQFPVSAMGGSAMVVPVKAKKQIFALLVVMREKDSEYGSSDQAMIEAVSDYASISLVNSRLFLALDERAENLQSAVISAKANESSKQNMLKNMSNELRSPLDAAMKNIAKYIIGEEGMLNEKQLSLLQDTQNNLERSADIIEAIAALDAVSSPQKLVEIDLYQQANQAAERLLGNAKENGIVLSVLDPGKSYRALADEKQMATVFTELLTNAVRHSSKGGKVKVSFEQAQGRNKVSVSDEGVGISKKDVEKVFERFFQANGTNQGLGMGLAMAKEIISAHGGKLWVESQPEAGSIFYFTLKAAE